MVDLLVATGLAASKSAARRTLNDGGAYLNNAKVPSETATAGVGDLLHGRWLVIRRGRKALAAVELVDA
jgi:tyrosyl-tRNA synthetase